MQFDSIAIVFTATWLSIFFLSQFHKLPCGTVSLYIVALQSSQTSHQYFLHSLHSSCFRICLYWVWLLPLPLQVMTTPMMLMQIIIQNQQIFVVLRHLKRQNATKQTHGGLMIFVGCANVVVYQQVIMPVVLTENVILTVMTFLIPVTEIITQYTTLLKRYAIMTYDLCDLPNKRKQQVK